MMEETEADAEAIVIEVTHSGSAETEGNPPSSQNVARNPIRLPSTSTSNLTEIDLAAEEEEVVKAVAEDAIPANDHLGEECLALTVTEANEEKVQEEEEEETLDSLGEKVKVMETERGQLTAEVLEKNELVDKMDREIAGFKADLKLSEEDRAAEREAAERKYKDLVEETAAKVAELKKQFHAANRDKESMVMKYAMGERDVIVQRKGKEDAERKLKAALREKEELTVKVKTLQVDKAKIQQLADSRLQDLNVFKKESDRWKEEVRVQESKACIANSRHKSEVEAHRECREQLDKTIKHLSETRGEIDTTRKECEVFMNKFRSDEESKVKRAETSQIEQSAKLIIDKAAASEMGTLREKYNKVIEENNGLSVKIQKIERERLESDEQISRLKENVTQFKRENVDLLAQVAEMESLRMHLQRSDEKVAAKSDEVERLMEESAEVKADMTACRQKEAELLEFTQKLTDKNVTLQSDLAMLEARFSVLESEHSRLSGQIGELKSSGSQTSIELGEERKRRTAETKLLVQKLAEKTKQAETLSQQTLDAENEVQVLKRKNATHTRELTKELQSCKTKLEQYTNNGLTVQVNNSSREISPGLLSSHSSRASSDASLNNNYDHPQSATSPTMGRIVPVTSASSLHQQAETNGLPNSPTHHIKKSANLLVPDSHVMVEKIVKLQRNLAKKHEKLEFMEEHVSTLLEEVKKKNRLIQHYIMKQESGTLTSEIMEENKPALIKKVHDEKERKISESGGIMASLYSSRSTDSSMTLDLSLEINKKLQAVLEDTLLKNITLKENINTLGNEIAKIATSGR